jgi:hypothetical protein
MVEKRVMGLLTIDEKTAPAPINNDSIQSYHHVVSLIEPIPRPNKHGHQRPYMEKYDEIHGPVLRSVYLRVVYE